MDGLCRQVVIFYVGVSKIFVLVRKERDVWAWLNGMCAYIDKARALSMMRRSEANDKVWFLECRLFGGKNTWQKCFGTTDSVRCSKFRGVRFSEVGNVLQVWDF